MNKYNYLVEIYCEDNTCSYCNYYDGFLCHCNMFNQHIDEVTNFRCLQCLEKFKLIENGEKI